MNDAAAYRPGTDLTPHSSAELVAAFDWSRTSLGPRATWRQCLKTAVGIVLNSKVPMVLLWGDEGVMIYNDAYSMFAGGRHPELLGSKVREGWPEVAEFNGHVMKVVLAGGTLAYRDQELTLYRSGVPEQVWMDLNYSPVLDEAGRPAGVLAIVIETTARARAEKARTDQARTLEILNRTGTIISAEIDLQRVVQVVTDAGVQLTGAGFGAFFYNVLNEAGESYMLYSLAGVDRSHFDKFPMPRATAIFQPTFKGEGVIRSDDILLDPRYGKSEPHRGMPKGHLPVRSYLAVPVASRSGEVLGGLFFGHPEPGVFSQYHEELITGIAGQAAVAIDNARLFESAKKEIEGRRAAETALTASEAKFRAIADHVDQMIWSTRADGFHDYYNQRWYDFTGVPQGTTDGEGWNGVFHPEDREKAWAVWRHSLETGEPYHIEYRLRHRSGQYRWVLGRAQPVRSAGGQIERWYGTCTDIQEIVEARQVLARSREELESLVQERTAERDRLWTLSEDLLARADYQGMMSAVSPSWTRLLGWSDAELLSQPYVTFMHPDDMAPTLAALEGMGDSTRPARFENRIAMKDGSWKPIEWTVVPEPDGANFIAVGRDLSVVKAREAELAVAQEALRQAQKMEAVGQLTGGIAHDFNNMLAVVIGSLDLLGRRLTTADDRSRRYVDAAADGARRAALLTQRLLAFSRQQPLRPEPIQANGLVAGMSDLVRRSLGAAIHLETVLAGGLWSTHADPNQLENVILNLAVNARDAMPDGGRLTIETQNAHLDRRYALAHPGVAEGQYVLIAVTDTGSGIPPDVMARVFDPFFTTKEVGKGTGLGLSQVYGFVKQSGGHVKIYSEPGQGTTVKVYLPRFIATGNDAPHDEVESELPTGDRQELVLVVEDEPAVRQFSVDALEELNYRVLEADGAATALRLLEAHPDIALLFTDVVMPEVNGRKLADEARRRRPDLKVLFTTGYTRNAVVHNGVLDHGVELIGKPFTLEELAGKVRQVLDEI